MSRHPSVSARLRVLASGSSGNCAVLEGPGVIARRPILIDAGIGPRRAGRELAAMGLRLADAAALLLTHFDHDHWRPEWLRALPAEAPVFVHRRHEMVARAAGLSGRAVVIDGDAEVGGLSVSVWLNDHDELGSAAYRISIPGLGDLGYATDLGRASPGLIDLFRGVAVLAIESNYCPLLQRASSRPAVLKRRIMGGRGHLSNQQALDATAAIGPRDHAVFLHLSRDCNRPDLVADLHAGADYALTIAAPDHPTRDIRLGPPATPRRSPTADPGLFDRTPEVARSAAHGLAV